MDFAAESKILNFFEIQILGLFKNFNQVAFIAFFYSVNLSSQ